MLGILLQITLRWCLLWPLNQSILFFGKPIIHYTDYHEENTTWWTSYWAIRMYKCISILQSIRTISPITARVFCTGGVLFGPHGLPVLHHVPYIHTRYLVGYCLLVHTGTGSTQGPTTSTHASNPQRKPHATYHRRTSQPSTRYQVCT